MMFLKEVLQGMVLLCLGQELFIVDLGFYVGEEVIVSGFLSSPSFEICS